jgi:hypothetical protein
MRLSKAIYLSAGNLWYILTVKILRGGYIDPKFKKYFATAFALARVARGS